jgi:hypothetical protein
MTIRRKFSGLSLAAMSTVCSTIRLMVFVLSIRWGLIARRCSSGGRVRRDALAEHQLMSFTVAKFPCCSDAGSDLPAPWSMMRPMARRASSMPTPVAAENHRRMPQALARRPCFFALLALPREWRRPWKAPRSRACRQHVAIGLELVRARLVGLAGSSWVPSTRCSSTRCARHGRGSGRRGRRLHARLRSGRECRP